jgi:hypothetical protein
VTSDETARDFQQFGFLTALIQNPLPRAVNSLLQLPRSRRADLVQIWFGGAADDQEVEFARQGNLLGALFSAAL